MSISVHLSLFLCSMKTNRYVYMYVDFVQDEAHGKAGKRKRTTNDNKENVHVKRTRTNVDKVSCYASTLYNLPFTGILLVASCRAQ